MIFAISNSLVVWKIVRETNRIMRSERDLFIKFEKSKRELWCQRDWWRSWNAAFLGFRSPNEMNWRWRLTFKWSKSTIKKISRLFFYPEDEWYVCFLFLFLKMELFDIYILITINCYVFYFDMNIRYKQLNKNNLINTKPFLCKYW